MKCECDFRYPIDHIQPCKACKAAWAEADFVTNIKANKISLKNESTIVKLVQVAAKQKG
jgi:hypothetical protein